MSEVAMFGAFDPLRLVKAEARIAELEAALEFKHQQYTGAVIALTEARKDSERLDYLLYDRGFRIGYNFEDRASIDSSMRGTR